MTARGESTSTRALPTAVAVHEAGHSYVAYRLGRPVGPVTCKPGRWWAGLSHYTPVGLPSEADWARLDPGLPPACWPARLRRSVETRALVTTAGQAAEDALYWPGQLAAGGVSGRRGESVVELAAELAPLTRPERDRLAAARRTESGPSDADNLADLAIVMHPDDPVAQQLWLAYVAAQARGLVLSGSGRLLRLAGVLTERGEVSGRAAREILAAGP